MYIINIGTFYTLNTSKEYNETQQIEVTSQLNCYIYVNFSDVISIFFEFRYSVITHINSN